jgi:hypothetical protein
MAGKVPWPEALPLAVGNGIDLEMHSGKLRGRLTITAKDAERDRYRCVWTCPGSQYDGCESFLSRGMMSEIGGIWQPRVLPSPNSV